MVNSFYSEEELKNIGLGSVGENVLISRRASIYSPDKISIGDNVRIDDFCILSGSIKLGSYIHISAYTALYGSNGISMDDFSGLSPRVTVFSSIDDFSGEYLINPMVPKSLTKTTGGLVKIDKFCQVGSHTVLLPGIVLAVGVVVGAMSLVKKDLEEWGIYAGVPAKFLKKRKKDLLGKYKDFFYR